MSRDFVEVLERLERLEKQNERLHRQNRCLKYAGVGATALFLLLGLSSCQSKSSGPATMGTLEVEKIVLKGSDGKMQALFTSSPKGPGLMLFGPGEPATPLIGLVADREGVPMLALYDSKGKGRIQLKVAKDDETMLMMTDDRGKERARFSVNGPGPGLTFWDETDQMKAMLSTGKTSTAFALVGPDKSTILLENMPERQRMVILNGKERLRAGLAVTPQVSAVELLDDQGRELFSKP